MLTKETTVLKQEPESDTEDANDDIKSKVPTDKFQPRADENPATVNLDSSTSGQVTFRPEQVRKIDKIEPVEIATKIDIGKQF